MKLTSHRRAAFTLVEIMLVVAIIGLLVAIAMPSFSKARTTSMKQKCIENQRLIFQATQLYQQDTATSLESIMNNGTAIRNTLFNGGYINQIAAFQCPQSPQIGYNNSYLLLYDNNNNLTNVMCYWFPSLHVLQ